MSKNKITALQVVERYHKRYLEYETAFNKNPFNREDLQNKLKDIVASNIDTDSEEFTSQMMEIMIEKPQKRAEVNNAALKFCLFTDFYLLTQEEDLPEDILKDYESLPIKNDIKSFYSVKDGDFVRNEDQEISNEMKNYFKEIIKQVQ